MTDQRLRRQLDRVASRMRRLRLWTALAGAWLVAALAGAFLVGLNRQLGWYSDHSVPAVSIAGLLLAGFFGWLAWRSVRDDRSVARQVEATFPDLRWSLVAAVEQQPELPDGRYGYLQGRVIAEALHHGYRNSWQQTVPGWRLITAQAANLTALIGLAVVLLVLSVNAGPPAADVGLSPLTPVGIVDRPLQIMVEPGDADVERGSSLLVMARLDGPLPADAVLVYETADGEVDRLPMSKSLDDPVFGGRIASVDEPLTYRVQFAEQTSDTYRVSVFEYPKLVRADGQLTFPEYTRLESRLVQDVRHLSVVEGTELELTCHLNKQVNEARLVEGQDSAVQLKAVATDPSVYRATLKLDRSRRFQVQLLDGQGRVNQQKAELVLTVVPNRPPDLKFVLPSRDVQVSPLEELELQANAWDDYGLNRVGLTYSVGGETPQDLVLGQSMPGKERVEIQHVVAFEELASEPDQLLSYHVWAEDAGPDGQLRRVSSDMFFAEVRPFDEIFRQGQSPPGGESGQSQQQQQQGGNAQAAQQLAEKQKEIINATWKLIRRETASELSDEFEDDLQLLVQSQAAAIEQADSMGERIQDSTSQQHLMVVKQKMLEAVQHLMRADEPPSSEPLPQALASEQAAYQALLKLRAREHRVVRNNRRQQQSRGSSSSSSGRAQQQLQQLQLSEDQNRYETERNAPSQQNQETQADRETRQVLNRLRELARRQSDLNKRLKELQSALQEASTEQEREEIRRQLKRLRDQEQQMLRDTDELQARMDQPQNQERMSDSRQQLQQTRDNVRQASEALQQGRVSRAAAAGTRAERQLNQLRDEFRRQASGQFDEQMQQMRDDAQQLAETQQALADRLAEQDGRRPDDPSPNEQDRSSDPFDSETEPPADASDPPQEPRPPNTTETADGRRGRSPDSPERPRRPARSLRDSGERQRLEEELQRQKQRLQELINRMQQTVLDAEQAEPLLAEQLYDTVRNAQQRQLDRVLDATSRSVREGLMDDAIQQENVARRGIDQLKDGVQRAAESVLGDETEALRRARDELNRLANELEEEVRRNRPAGRPAQTGGQGAPGQDENQDRQDGQPGQPQERPEPAEGQASSRAGNSRPAEDRNPSGQEPGQADRDQASPDHANEPSGESGQRGTESGSGQTQQSGSDGSRRPAQPGLRPEGSESRGQSRGGARSGSGSRNRSSGGLGGFEPFLDDSAPASAPMAGEDFLSWSDRLRDVEEMVDDPQLRAEAARIRDRAKGIRLELKRHSKPPNWDLVQLDVFAPLVQLRDRVAEELLKRTSQDALVPIDRDPVPPKYAEDVRRYYERLGSGL